MERRAGRWGLRWAQAAVIEGWQQGVGGGRIGAAEGLPYIPLWTDALICWTRPLERTQARVRAH